MPDDPYLGRELSRYFPSQLVEQYPDALEQHRLRREIISTQLTNSMINRGGPSFAVRIGDQTGAPAPTIAAAFFVVRNSYDMIALNSAIDALDNKVSGKLQLDLYAAVEDLLLDRIVWFVRNVDISKGLAEVGRALSRRHRGGRGRARRRAAAGCGARSLAARTTELVNAGVPEDLARRLAQLAALAAAPDIVLGRGPHRQTGAGRRRDLFRGGRVLPARPHRQRGARHPGHRLFRPARARPRARLRSARRSGGSPPRWSATA